MTKYITTKSGHTFKSNQFSLNAGIGDRLVLVDGRNSTSYIDTTITKMQFTKMHVEYDKNIAVMATIPHDAILGSKITLTELIELQI